MLSPLGGFFNCSHDKEETMLKKLINMMYEVRDAIRKSRMRHPKGS